MSTRQFLTPLLFLIETNGLDNVSRFFSIVSPRVDCLPWNIHHDKGDAAVNFLEARLFTVLHTSRAGQRSSSNDMIANFPIETHIFVFVLRKCQSSWFMYMYTLETTYHDKEVALTGCFLQTAAWLAKLENCLRLLPVSCYKRQVYRIQTAMFRGLQLLYGD